MARERCLYCPPGHEPFLANALDSDALHLRLVALRKVATEAGNTRRGRATWRQIDKVKRAIERRQGEG